MKVLVILGGDSAEKDVSLKSGKNIALALKLAGYEVVKYNPADSGISLADAVIGVDAVFPIIHGRGGEDGVLQKQLEELNVPFVGSSSMVSANCFNKCQTKKCLPGVRFPVSEVVTSGNISDSLLLKKPYVIKPIAEGSSFGVYIVRVPDKFDITELATDFSSHGGELLIEELVSGIEFTVPVLINRALPVVEIIPPKGQEFDYENKYNGATAENCPPKMLVNTVQLRAQKIALTMHRQMGCKGFSRSDFIVTKDGKIFALEINTLPGMTKESLFPKSAATVGVQMPELVKILVDEAMDSHKFGK